MGTTSTKTHLVTGYAALGAGKSLEPLQYELPALGSWDISIEVAYCGLCHSDLHLINNELKGINYPLIAGHEIVGTVREVGRKVEQFAPGDRVAVGWQSGSCQVCNYCRSGKATLCEKSEATCVGRAGGFSQGVVVDSRFAFHAPKSMAPELVAPLLCGGATVYTPLIDHQVNSAMRVGVIGLGGLGHLAVQFAHKMGCEVVVFSTSANKEKEARSFGADHFVVSTNRNAMEREKGSIDFFLHTVSSAVDLESYLGLLKPEGKLCLLGAISSSFELPIMPMISKNLAIVGSHIGSPAMIESMLAFAERMGVAPKIELFELSDINRALKKLASNDIHYRAVLKVS